MGTVQVSIIATCSVTPDRSRFQPPRAAGRERAAPDSARPYTRPTPVLAEVAKLPAVTPPEHPRTMRPDLRWNSIVWSIYSCMSSASRVRSERPRSALGVLRLRPFETDHCGVSVDLRPRQRADLPDEEAGDRSELDSGSHVPGAPLCWAHE